MIHRDHRARESELKLSDYRGRNAPSFSPHHLGINKRRSMREGGIERREKPESINSFVIDATSSIRKTIESVTRFSNCSITIHRSITCPLNVTETLYTFSLGKESIYILPLPKKNFLKSLNDTQKGYNEFILYPQINTLFISLLTNKCCNFLLFFFFLSFCVKLYWNYTL